MRSGLVRPPFSMEKWEEDILQSVAEETNMSGFVESIQMWINNLSVNSIIIFIMMIFMLIGAVDRML